MSGAFVSGPLDSNTRANPTKAFYGGGGGLVGVTSLNAQIGTLAVTGDASIGVSAPGLGAIQVSTAGRPQAVGTLSCTSLNTGTGTFTGAVAIASGASVAAGLSVGTLTSTGVATAGSFTTLNGVTANNLIVGGVGRQCNVQYDCVNTAITDNGNHNVGSPVNYPALITVAVTGAATSGGTSIGYLEAIYVSTPVSGGWSVRLISAQSNGININLINDNTPAGPQITFYVNAGTPGIANSMWKVERLGQP